MNKNKDYYAAWQLKDVCAYCGGYADTEDHVPSRCFLDKPHPADLPVVPCCKKCNKDFSLDEEYVSCALDCFHEQTLDVKKLSREKTINSLKHTPALLTRIQSEFQVVEGELRWNYDEVRLHNVLRKLALGHLAYQVENLSFTTNPKISFCFIEDMTMHEYEKFMKPYHNDFLAEVGSRELQDVFCLVDLDSNESTLLHTAKWHIIQPHRYQYCVSSEEPMVKFIIADTLAVEARIE